MSSKDIWTQIISDARLYNGSSSDLMQLIINFESKYSVSLKATDTIEKRKCLFKEEIRPHVGTYPAKMCNDFYSYWIETNKTGKKMRFELEKTWDTKKRLARWANTNKEFKNGNHVNGSQTSLQVKINHVVQQEHKPLMSTSEAEYEWKETMRRQFAKFKETGFLNITLPAAQLKEFERMGLIKMSEEEKAKLLSEAKEIVIKYKRQQRLVPVDDTSRHELTACIHRIESGNMDGFDRSEINSQYSLTAIENFYKQIDKLIL